MLCNVPFYEVMRCINICASMYLTYKCDVEIFVFPYIWVNSQQDFLGVTFSLTNSLCILVMLALWKACCFILKIPKKFMSSVDDPCRDYRAILGLQKFIESLVFFCVCVCVCLLK